jgi:hypothetical protein
MEEMATMVAGTFCTFVTPLSKYDSTAFDKWLTWTILAVQAIMIPIGGTKIAEMRFGEEIKVEGMSTHAKETATLATTFHNKETTEEETEPRVMSLCPTNSQGKFGKAHHAVLPLVSLYLEVQLVVRFLVPRRPSSPSSSRCFLLERNPG